jgi:3-deoxy-manno-octulosonate cytidylyltransferase (CMP-KDO synthetase)
MTSTHHPSGTDRVAEVASGADEDLILNLQADEPLIMPSSLKLLAGTLRERPEADIATLARRPRVPSTARESVVKVTVDERGHATDFFRQGSPLTEGAWEHIGVYCYRRDSLLFLAKQSPTTRERDHNLEQLRALDLGMTIVVAITDDQCVGVNTADELDQVRGILEKGETAMPGPQDYHQREDM